MFQRWKTENRLTIQRPNLNVEVGRRASDPIVTSLADRASQSKRRITKLKSGEKIYDLYYWEEVLQEDGDGGKVVVCRRKSDESKEFKYVLKIRSKKTIAEQEAQSGTQFHQTLLRVLNLPPHLGVTPILEVLENDEYYYVVMEKAAGGSLVDHLLSRHSDGIMPEEDLKQMMRDMLEAVGHVHKQGVLHRDIKPQNFVVRKIEEPDTDEPEQNGPEGDASPKTPKKVVERVSLIDFDHADADYSPCSPSPKTDCVFGTQGFNAPEQYLGHSSPSSDLWSLGVILYLFMTGNMPYDVGRLEKEAKKEHRNFSAEGTTWFHTVYDKMMEAAPKWDCDPWLKNKACTDFCQKLLTFHAQARPQSAEAALLHPWLSQDASVSEQSTRPSSEEAADPPASES